MTDETEILDSEARDPSGGSGTGPGRATDSPYVLEDQIGHILRRVHQRASALFAAGIGPSQLTPTQFAALVKIRDEGAVSQNRLGRMAAMDPATMQGVVGRLLDRNLIVRAPDPADRRQMLLRLSENGRRLVDETVASGARITRETLAPLTGAEQKTLLRLLRKLR